MKTIVSMAMGVAVLYQAAKRYGIHSFKDVKALVTAEIKDMGREVKHQLVTT